MDVHMPNNSRTSPMILQEKFAVNLHRFPDAVNIIKKSNTASTNLAI